MEVIRVTTTHLKTVHANNSSALDAEAGRLQQVLRQR